MKIDFYLRYSTLFGQKLSITGNIPSQAGNDEEGIRSMQFLNSSYWHVSIEVDASELSNLQYRYVLTTETGEEIKEGEKKRVIDVQKNNFDHLVLVDTWNYAGAYENAFYTAPFKEVFCTRPSSVKTKKNKSFTHRFKTKSPLLNDGEAVCLLGSDSGLNNWDIANPIILEKSDDWWSCQVDLSSAEFPLVYKYGVYNVKERKFSRYEEGDNRFLPFVPSPGSKTILHDGFVRLPNNIWKGAGVAIPVFSLRSSAGLGVGEFNDLKLLADWASEVGLKLIQILPVNDTTATFTWLDSYPYAAISAFALHPIYINLQKVAGKKFESSIKSIRRKQKHLNALAELDYEEVMQFKIQVLRELYELDDDAFLKEELYKEFFKENVHWLKPYAVFSYLRDKHQTSAFNEWKTAATFTEDEIERISSSRSKAFKKIKFYYFVQYHLHLQLKEAVDYAHRRGVVLKGDIPIGIYRNSVDAWAKPELYHMNWQAGAPPDDFAVKGQNWGFPTYNWKKMQEDHFEWWRLRFQQMSTYFDAFRIDHILGFFRIWSIPMDAVEGILGRFVPALPVHVNELGERGIWFNKKRFCEPYITDAVLSEVFDADASFVRDHFLQVEEDNAYKLKEEFNTQRKVEDYFAQQNEENQKLKIGLFDLITNVIFFERPGSEGQTFDFRISMESTTSYQHLDEQMKWKLKQLYIDYFYNRQDDFWKKEALQKLPHLKDSTEMLICGEDLGMVPHSVPDVMKNLGILSLEIQRMPKNPLTEFFHPKDAPYLSVITPSTHDMSTIRAWWEENREKTIKFYHTVLESHGEPPVHCDSWINRAIILQHLYSPAMWSIFQLQDLLGMNDDLRRENAQEERINDPANPKHYWRYRMHISIEQLLKEKEFNKELRDYIQNSGRN
jgi:4-alpha-glucanotransferase